MVFNNKPQGFSLEITARTEADIDPSVIIKKIKDSSGSKYSYHENGIPAVSQAPDSVTNSPFVRLPYL
jgi:hypothetical protein